jgi:hypothetical protein
MKKKNKKKSVVDRINEKQMRMEWDYAARELRGYTDKEIHGKISDTIHNGQIR